MCDSSVLITHSSLKYSVQGASGDDLFWRLSGDNHRLDVYNCSHTPVASVASEKLHLQ